MKKYPRAYGIMRRKKQDLLCDPYAFKQYCILDAILKTTYWYNSDNYYSTL